MWLWLLWLLLAALPRPAQAFTYYVDQDGVEGVGCNNGNSGAKNSPRCSIAAGRALLSSGDTLLIRAGTYGSGMNFTPSNTIPSGSNDTSRTTIAGHPGETVTLTGSLDIQYANGVDGQVFRYITFQNLRLVGSGGLRTTGCGYRTLSDGFPSPGHIAGDGINMNCGPHFVRFQDIDVSGVYCDSGVGNGNGASDLEYLRVSSHDNGTPGCGQPGQPPDHGWYVLSPRTLYDQIEAYGNQGYGLQLYDSGCPTLASDSYTRICGNDSIIRNSSFHDNLNYGGMTVGHGSNVQVYNNIVYNNNGDGIAIGYGNPQNVQVYNNTIANQTGKGISLGEPGSGSTAINTMVKNNIIMVTGTRVAEQQASGTQYDRNLCSQTGLTGCTHSGNADFVGTGADPYKISSTSAARNQGVTLTTFSTDRANAQRGQGGAWDIGAYEYAEGGQTPPPDTTPPPLYPGVKAFPTAEGFGAADTIGGRGGAVMQVTNLNDSGTGSFRACAEGTGPRTCVFRVGGTINLLSAINIVAANSNLTIAGQTAPGQGITLTPWPINISYGANHVIIRHLRHRQGYEEAGMPTGPPAPNNDCGGFVLYGPSPTHTHHIVLDHVSTGYTCDDSMQMSGYVTDATIQWALVADPYECKQICDPTCHCQLDPYGASKGFIFGGNDPTTAPLSTGSVHHTMFLNTNTRNPGGGPQGVMDWRYNLIYHWSACTGGLRLGGTDESIPGPLQSNHNFVGNRYLAGPETQQDFTGAGCWLGALRTEGNAHVYVQDNVTPWCGYDSCGAAAWDLGWGNESTGGYPAASSTFQVFAPFSAPGITPTARTAMESTLAQQAGATVPYRDSLDIRVIDEMQRRTGNIGRLGAPWPTIANCNGISTTLPCTAAPTDTDSDGMPDAWETAHGLNPANAADRNAMTTPVGSPNGYTNLENYLNELAGDPIPGGGPPPVQATGNPIYVRGTLGDDDANDCVAAESPTTAKRTLSGPKGALSCMVVPGKVLYVEGNGTTYTEEIDTHVHPITGGNGPSFSDATRIEGYGSPLPVLQAPVVSATGVTLFLRAATDRYLVFKLLTIDGANRAQNTIAIYGTAQHIRFEQIEAKNTAVYEGLYISDATDITVVDSFIHHTQTTGIELNASVTDFTCQRCHIFNAGGTGILIDPEGTKSNLVIRESEVRNNTTDGITVGASTGTVLQNLLVYSNGGKGLWLQSGTNGARVYQNTVYGNTGMGVQCDVGATGAEIKNNIVRSNTAGDLLNNCGATEAKTRTTDPMFANVATNDFHLADGSDCINTGDPLPSVTVDYGGSVRPDPQNGLYDIGAYERGQALPVEGGATVTVSGSTVFLAEMFF